MISSIQDFKSKIEAIEWPNFWPFNSPAHVQSSDTKYELLGDLDLIELESLEPTPRAAARSSASNVRAAGWIIVNIVSTVLIVS
ncbi:hypothetical protein N7510_011277 [Penicillium lagena]|uniref:uncharacterized protein n=1 Tax=Penicillium lagena TaxID=94218 RepID=UPI002541E496|nr:uncharacterized protein N7510_011277 [Penicillium lagena]KAJ5601743.1 hypothetical protein N7510_011277 [Penicillium lagena]